MNLKDRKVKSKLWIYTLQETGQPGHKKKKNQSHGNPDRHVDPSQLVRGDFMEYLKVGVYIL